MGFVMADHPAQRKRRVHRTIPKAASEARRMRNMLSGTPYFAPPGV